jgi:hypothetical protein
MRPCHVLRRMVREHLLDVGSTASAAVAGRRGGAHGDLMQSPGAFMDRAQDRPVLDVVAAADGLETAECRMQVFRSVHHGEANTMISCALPFRSSRSLALALLDRTRLLRIR